ncbi:hypothetical protein ACJIZ3_013092 [Penstemon smallii]|uniref:RRM domain-containing protein n=1 Tax=Penstemon smallii TaxID=265156 RepID=A0ABD3UPA0_9LAMI
MDVSSPDNGFDDINDFLKDDDATFPDDLDLDFIVDKDIAQDCVYGDLAVNDKFHLDLSKQEKQEPSSLSSSFRYYDNLESPQNIYSSVQSGFQNDTLGDKETVADPGKLQVQSNENIHNEDSETLCDSYFHDSIFQMDSSPILQEIQNDDSALPHELVSMQDTNFHDILDKSTSPAHNEIVEHSYIEAVQNEPTQSEREEVPGQETEKLSFSPGSWSRDPETKRENINESRNSPCGYKEFEPSVIDQENHERSPELYKSPYTNGETLSSPTMFSISYQSPDIHELPGSLPEHQIIPNSARLLKQTPSPTECNQENESHSPKSQEVCPRHEVLVQSSCSPKSCKQKHVSSERSNSWCRSKSPCARNNIKGSPNAVPQHQSLKSKKSSASQECMIQQPTFSRSCMQKHEQAKMPNCRRSRSRSPYNRSCHNKSFESPRLPSSFKSSEEKTNESYRTTKRNISRSRSPCTRECHKKSPDKTSSKQLSQKKMIYNLQDPAHLSSSSRSDNQKSESDYKSKYNRLHARSSCRGDFHKRSLHEDPSTGRSLDSEKLSALQDDHDVSSSSRLRKMKSVSIETCKQKRSRSKSPDIEDCNKKSTRTAPTVKSSNRYKASITEESLQLPSSSKLRKQITESPERSNLGRKFGSNDSVRHKQHSISPRTSRQKRAEIHVPALPRRPYTHHNHRIRGRSISPSHTRQKDFSSGYMGDICNRHQSRSPNRRGNGMKYPRGRRSSRHRSPPPGHYRLHSRSRRTHWSPPQDRSTGLGKPGRDLFIAGFNFITTERDLERKFSRFGRVRDVRIVRDKRSGESRGFGFLTLERDEEADAAIRALDKTEWGGRIVLVEKTKSH